MPATKPKPKSPTRTKRKVAKATKMCAHKVNAAEIKGFERGYNRGLQHGRKGH